MSPVRLLLSIVSMVSFIFISGFDFTETRTNTGLYENAKGSPLLSLLKSAKQSIDIEIYEMGDVEILKTLQAAIEKGVKIRVVQEPRPVGNPCPIFDVSIDRRDPEICNLQRSLVKEVIASGGEYVAFNKESLCGVEGKSCFQHGKIVIIDGRVALISTGNFNASSLCDLNDNPSNCDMDYSYITQDTNIIGLLQTTFDDDVTGKAFDLKSVVSESETTRISISPIALTTIVDFINSAQETLQIENQYLEEPTINAAIENIARRGVKVEVTVASVCAFAKPNAHKAAAITKTYGTFEKAGISSKFFTKQNLIKDKPGYLHAKAIVVDGTHAWIGSINGSNESLLHNREYGIFFDDAKSVQTLTKAMTTNHYAEGSETLKESLACEMDK